MVEESVAESLEKAGPGFLAEIVRRDDRYKSLEKVILGEWEEYASGKSREARLVKEADKLEMLLQALEYEREGYDVKDFWAEEYKFEVGEGVYKELLKKKM